MNFLKLVLLTFFFIGNLSIAQDHDDHHGSHGHIFAPQNDYVLDDGDVNEVTKELVDKRIAKAMEIYGPIAEEKYKRSLYIKNLWSNSTVNARVMRASVDGKQVLKVEMFGGISKHFEATLDSTTAILCHEIGHHMGGAPKYSGGMSSANKWASNEGQSDYWASLKCLRKMFGDDDNVTIMQERAKIFSSTKNKVRKKANQVAPYALEQCESVYKSESEAYLCYRIAIAGMQTARILQSLKFGFGAIARRWFPSRVERGMPKFNKKDNSKVSKTNNKHPAAQCRLDTYLAGALCDKPIDEDVDAEDPNIGSCSISNGDKVGNRPACWFKA